MRTVFKARSAALLLSACLGLSACSTEELPQQDAEAKALGVQVQALSELMVPIAYSAPALASSLNESTLKAELSARIDAIPARVGDKVKRGAVLVKLNCADAKAQQAQAKATSAAAKARSELAQQQLERARSLIQKNTISRELLAQREAEARAAEAEHLASQAALDIATNQRQRCQITAPFTAVITERLGQVGELASAGIPLIKLVQSDGLEVSADIVPAQASSLAQAKEIVFRSDNRDYAVELRAITDAINSLSRTREARLRFTAESPLPGTPGRLHWTDQRPGLPASLISERKGQLGVMVAEQAQARFIALSGAEEGRAVATDLPPETLIITTGRHSVADDSPIEVLAE